MTDPDSERGGGSRGPGGLGPPTPADQREKESAPAAWPCRGSDVQPDAYVLVDRWSGGPAGIRGVGMAR